MLLVKISRTLKENERNNQRVIKKLYSSQNHVFSKSYKVNFPFNATQNYLNFSAPTVRIKRSKLIADDEKLRLMADTYYSSSVTNKDISKHAIITITGTIYLFIILVTLIDIAKSSNKLDYNLIFRQTKQRGTLWDRFFTSFDSLQNCPII